MKALRLESGSDLLFDKVLSQSHSSSHHATSLHSRKRSNIGEFYLDGEPINPQLI